MGGSASRWRMHLALYGVVEVEGGRMMATAWTKYRSGTATASAGVQTGTNWKQAKRWNRVLLDR